MKKYTLLFFILCIVQKQFSQQGICFTPAGFNPISGSIANCLLANDFNNDGRPDMVFGWLTGHSFNISLSNGNAYPGISTFTFAPLISYIASSDFNSDGNADLSVTYNDSNYVKIIFGDGTGNFNTATILPVGTMPLTTIVKDLNNDGKPDLAVCNYSSNNVSVCLRNSNGFTSSITTPVGVKPQSIISGDFNNDGSLDLATTNYSTISILKGNSSGNFTLVTTLNFATSMPSFEGGKFISAFDCNADGKADLAVIRGDSLFLFKSTSNFGFTLPVAYYVGQSASSVDSGDLDNDGRTDLVTANYNGKNYTVLTNNGTGGFSGIVSYSIVGTSTVFNLTSPACIAVAEMNGDGKKDLLIGYDNAQNITVLLNCNTVNVGLNEAEHINNSIIDIFPNPAAGFINIQFSNLAGINKVEIINYSGQLIKENECLNENTVIDTGQLPNGVYLLFLKDNDITLGAKRFVIAR